MADPPHVLITLLGRFKGELGEQYHKMPLSAVTTSGLQVRLWVGHLLEEFQRLNIHHGPMFRGIDGQPIKSGEIKEDFFSRLEKVLKVTPT
jgi:hypothetical protein